MKTYFADTNLYLRFLLQDNKSQAEKVKSYLQEAKKGAIKIIFINAVIIEMAIVLERLYKLSREEIAENLSSLVKTPYLDVVNGNVWLITFQIFTKTKIDLLDIFLFEMAKEYGGLVLSFDKDLEKLSNL